MSRRKRSLSSFSRGVGVPEAAAVRTDFVGEDDFAVGGAAKFDFEIHQEYVAFVENVEEDGVDLVGEFVDAVEFFVGGDTEGDSVVVVNQRVAEFVVL